MTQLSNAEIAELVTAYQKSGFMHPLTCQNNTAHEVLAPVTTSTGVKLRCPTCNHISLVPDFIFQLTVEEIETEKEELRTKGFVI